MKALIIGGTGSISEWVSRQAIEKGWELCLLNRGRMGVEIPGAKSIRGDINNEQEVAVLLQGMTFDVVADFVAFTPEHIERDMRLFAGRVGHYLFVSSASVYQKPTGDPVITESTPLKNPWWQYSRDKIACEDLLNRAWREQDFPMTIVRPSLTYYHLIPMAFASWRDYTIVDRMKKGKEVVVHGDGTSLWTITHSRDFARGFVGLFGNMQALGHAFHITSDEILTWDQIYQAVAAAAGASANIVHIPTDFIVKIHPDLTGTLLGDKTHSVVFDNSKIKRFVPGFVATTTFAQGMQESVAWMEETPERKAIVEQNNAVIDSILAAWREAAKS